LTGTRAVHAHADMEHRNQAVRIANATQQNIRFLSRKQPRAAGEEWVDPFSALAAVSAPAAETAPAGGRPGRARLVSPRSLMAGALFAVIVSWTPLLLGGLTEWKWFLDVFLVMGY